ncbi:hypothetical protein CARUB_v10006981mg [Capsella rubella]|uniref:Peptidase A1 domain-containing protein n=1 Tax=Capsella rubella TaxID=81985 RepID=R0F920_9BRAS|nr:hypothetical protein CARUB_v10006981mg [Capsella rubella]
MKILIIFLIPTFLPLLLNAEPKTKTLYLPLVHINKAQYFDSKILAPPVTAPGAYKGLAFVAEIFIGSPAVRQFLHIDTGSTLTWNQCYPCSLCVNHIYPRYWPEDSTTYWHADCETTSTESNPRFEYFHSSGICRYKQGYADGSFIQGTLIKEMFLIQTMDRRFEALYDVYLGCNYQALGHNYIGTGILGLGLGNFSIVEKLGSKFSFCIGRIREDDSTHNLILGDGANIQGHPTMISISNGHYMFQLEAIRVGVEKTLDNPLQVYLDTGSTFSHLPKGLYKDIVNKVKNIVGVKPLSRKSPLCYAIDASKIPEDIDIGFIFEGGAELSVDARSLFVTIEPGNLCLAINESPNEDQVVIGAAAMQGYNIGYDIKAKMVYLQKQNCNM